ncbi:MAG TPA: signal recognition particle protein [Peptococcaceae bacterium]|nr:signal recognition particle protein [Peptococcaceae bacterium]
MAFESLSDRLQNVFKRLRSKGKLTEQDVTEAMREVRMALLEADVNYKVVKDFIAVVKERSIGSEVMESLTPGQQVVKIVNEELTRLMGNNPAQINNAGRGPTVIMMVGLQGSGKTTSSAKLARHLKKQGRRPMLAACDIYRPAAIKQLEVLGQQLDIPVFSLGDKVSPVEIAKGAYAAAERQALDILILDTAGRLHVDDALMAELDAICAAVPPQEILLVVDAMTGQDVVKVTETFNARLALTGVVLTKMDGDTRGGAALSVKAVTGKPIKYVGMGEKTDALEPFYPDRMASRILGMGDMLTLIEKAQESVDLKKAQEMETKLRKAEFTLDDFLDQMQQMKNMGPLDQLLGMIPGAGKIKGLKDLQIDEKDMAHTEAIIRSMTAEERRKPMIINGSRRKRIAAGSGTTLTDVNRLLKQFEQGQKMMKQMSQMSKGGHGKKGFKLPFM